MVSMNIYSPIEPHADTDPDSRCDIHDRTDLDLVRRWTAGSTWPRLWHVTGDEPVHASLHLSDEPARFTRAPEGISLAPGTRLRLDASGGPERHYDGGEHYSTTRRFCVLDGPMAGTCWEAHESVAADESGRFVEPVAPLTVGGESG